jgi:manganese efflux pump family protein
VGWVSLLAIAVALAMDAFAVSVAAGVTLDCLTRRRVFRLAFHFGLFQGLMPVLGWAGGTAIHGYIAPFDHWVAFGLLAFVGARMMCEAVRGGGETQDVVDPTSGWTLVLLSVATSIDALAVGLSLAMIGSSIVVPALIIGVVAAAFTVAGMLLGRRIGRLWGNRVAIVGGALLIGLGVKILWEHLHG